MASHHPAFVITPAQHAAVNALCARLVAAIDGAPKAWSTARATRLLAKLDREVSVNSHLGLSFFLKDWRLGIESECLSLENARECRDVRRAA